LLKKRDSLQNQPFTGNVTELPLKSETVIAIKNICNKLIEVAKKSCDPAKYQYVLDNAASRCAYDGSVLALGTNEKVDNATFALMASTVKLAIAECLYDNATIKLNGSSPITIPINPYANFSISGTDSSKSFVACSDICGTLFPGGVCDTNQNCVFTPDLSKFAPAPGPTPRPPDSSNGMKLSVAILMVMSVLINFI